MAPQTLRVPAVVHNEGRHRSRVGAGHVPIAKRVGLLHTAGPWQDEVVGPDRGVDLRQALHGAHLLRDLVEELARSYVLAQDVRDEGLDAILHRGVEDHGDKIAGEAQALVALQHCHCHLGLRRVVPVAAVPRDACKAVGLAVNGDNGKVAVEVQVREGLYLVGQELASHTHEPHDPLPDALGLEEVRLPQVVVGRHGPDLQPHFLLLVDEVPAPEAVWVYHLGDAAIPRQEAVANGRRSLRTLGCRRGCMGGGLAL
mmetsp:Transcript_60806/g.181170  ORF Transcript_60806/g.181170 Transcript_60806/m.181170 type:complete len:257 (-) Transcript_60806:62-832(-)